VGCTCKVWVCSLSSPIFPATANKISCSDQRKHKHKHKHKCQAQQQLHRINKQVITLEIPPNTTTAATRSTHLYDTIVQSPVVLLQPQASSSSSCSIQRTSC
jgi:hypothetical protein